MLELWSWLYGVAFSYNLKATLVIRKNYCFFLLFSTFQDYNFKSTSKKEEYRQVVRFFFYVG